MIIRLSYILMAIMASFLIPATLADANIADNPVTANIISAAPGTPIQQAYFTLNSWEIILTCLGIFAGMRSAPFGLELYRWGMRRVALYQRKEIL